MRIVLVLLLGIALFGEEFKFEMENILKTHSIYGSGKSKYIKSHDDLHRVAWDFNVRAEYYHFGLDIDVEAFHHNKEIPDYKNVSLGYKKRNDLQINSIMLSHKYKDISVYGGFIPFRGGKFSEIQEPSKHGGNGIELLIDQVFLGSFLRYEYEGVNFIAGVAEWTNKANYNSLGYDNNDGSDGFFSIINYEKDRHYFELNYFTANVVSNSGTEEPLDYTDITLYGAGYIFDDTAYSGFLFSIEGGISNSKENVEGLIDSRVPASYQPFLPYAGFETENQDNTGYAWKANLKYEDEIGSHGYFIGTEYFKTYANWVSMNHGTLFLSNHSWWQNREADQYSVFGGFDITDNLSIESRYTKTISRKVPNFFSISKSTDIENVQQKEDWFTNLDKIEFKIVYKF